MAFIGRWRIGSLLGAVVGTSPSLSQATLLCSAPPFFFPVPPWSRGLPLDLSSLSRQPALKPGRPQASPPSFLPFPAALGVLQLSEAEALWLLLC